LDMVAQWPSYATRCDAMNVIEFSELGEDIRASLQGKRWLLLTAEELSQATAALMFSELEDVLVAVDYRGHDVEDGMWARAVHLLLVDEGTPTSQLQRETGISKVVSGSGELTAHLW